MAHRAAKHHGGRITFKDTSTVVESDVDLTAALVVTCLLVLTLVGWGRARRNFSGMSRHTERARLAPDELLSKHRTVLLRGEIDDKSAQQVIAQLLFLKDRDRDSPVWLYIDSIGGEVTASLAICDAIDDIKLPVFTYCLGTASGVAAMLLAHGAHGHRSAAPNARLSVLPLWARDRADASEAVTRLQTVVASLIAADSHQALDRVTTDLAAAREFDVESARSYGLIDRIEE